MLADLRSESPVVAIQVPYNLMPRDPERELFPMAKEEDVGVTGWGLLGGGVLTGKYRDVNVDKRYESASEDRMAVADKVVEIADKVGRSPSQVKIDWVSQQQDKALIIPIIGVRTLDQIKDNLVVLDFELSPDQLLEIGNLSDF
jgi:aryl-alcohol dehydrogenase-like predicted oxidoreductase